MHLNPPPLLSVVVVRDPIVIAVVTPGSITSWLGCWSAVFTEYDFVVDLEKNVN